MLVFVPFLLLFITLGLLWVVAAGLLVAHFVLRAPSAMEKMLDHGEQNCACYLGLKRHNAA
jgi:hypothetical protein